MVRRSNTEQGILFEESQSLQTQVILKKSDFEKLFEGFTKMRAISYVVSPDLLLEFFERGYTDVEMIVGENISEPTLRQTLEKKDSTVIEKLTERVGNSTLRIYVPDRTIHTKLYFLEKPGLTRVIQTSANLTETARLATRQVNYAWYADFTGNDSFLSQITDDYQIHLKGCSLFMGDLIELLGQHSDIPRQEVIEMWLKGEAVEEADSETRLVVQQITLNSLQYPVKEQTIVRVQLPERSVARRQAEKLLQPLQPIITKNEMSVNAPDFIHYVEKNYHFPPMRVDLEQRKVLLGINGSIKLCTEDLPDDTSVVNDALGHIERYLQTVDIGQSPDPKFAKTSMFETLLYMLSAPFANEYMKIKRRSFGVTDRRGPLFLYIYGASQNGKSTFLRFALKLLTGQIFEPLPDSDFTKKNLVTATYIGSVFPLVFDDLVPTKRVRLFQEVLKAYWEVWWKDEYVYPQIIMSSNTYNLQEWAKSRVKRVDFDVQFAPSAQDRARLNQILSEDNQIFKWFSHLYMQHLLKQTLASEDELQLARIVFKELYDHAKRNLPDFFPHEPIEKLYDPSLRAWHELLNRLGKAKVRYEKDRAVVNFSSDMQPYEIREYTNSLPQKIKQRRRGNTLIIENPNDFRVWMDGQPRAETSLLGRFKKFLR